ncbi:amino acid ABC transporter ATP-binding/permease protein [Alloscardovia omnicolens]|uniref:amino acid ABC transporter ATP-binding/permease protein n=1 Tax=Alloscardovia omnicolens TaxID=419015 RepID=UPI003A70E088
MTSTQLMRRMATFMKHLMPIEIQAIINGSLGYLAVPALVVCATMAMFNIWVGNTMNGIILAVAALVFAIVRGIFAFLEQYYNHLMAFTVLRDLRNILFNHVQALAPARLAEQGRGKLVSALTEDIELLEIFYAHTLSPLAIAVITTLVQVILIALVHPLLGAVALLSYVLLGVVVPLIVSRPTSHWAMAEREAQGVVYSQLLESLDSERSLTFSSALNAAHATVQNSNTQLLHSRAKRYALAGYNKLILDILSLISIAAFGAVDVYLYATKSLDAPFAALTFAAFVSSLVPIQAITRLGTGLQPTMAAARRVFSLLDTEPAVDEIEDKDGVHLNDFAEEKADNISFSYGDNSYSKNALTDVSVHVQPRDMIVIQGENGSGKSTLINLLMRFYDPHSGSITVNDVALTQIATQSLRHTQALVSQQTHIFSSSLADNLRIAKPEASEKELQSVIESVQLSELVDSWDDGMNHVLVRNGAELSDGQRQRIAVARAFLSDAPLIFLDEPTANMDALLEAQLIQTLVEQQNNRAYVIISHRPAPARYASAVFHMHDGHLTKSHA